MKTIIQAFRTLLVFMLIFYCVGVYAQRKEVSYFNDSVEICPLADKELIDSCYNLLDRNMMLETDGIYGQIAVIDATTSEVLAWASLEKQLDGDCGWCGDMVYVPFKKQVCSTDIFVPFIAAKCLEESNTSLGKMVDTIQKSNAIELAISFNQMYHQKSSLEYVKKIATGIFEKTGIQHRLAPRGIKLAGIYNILQYDDNKRSSDEFTFVGCFPADNPKYTISMVVVRPHKLPANIGMLSKEVNLLIEWLMNRNI